MSDESKSPRSGSGEERNGQPDSGKPELQAVPSIRHAMRRVRIEDAERTDVVAELRGAEQARLEMLAEALEPIFAQLPDDVDLFDAGVVPGERPRLFIDMIGFVDMGADKRTYRFVQDTRHGRVVILETERQERMVEAVTDYVARRLLERERALASDLTLEDAARDLLAREGYRNRGGGDERTGRTGAGAPAAVSSEAASRANRHDGAGKSGRPGAGKRTEQAAGASQPSAALTASPTTMKRRLGWLWDTIEFFALFIGFVVLLIGLAGAVYFAWTMGEGWWISKFFKTSAGG